MKNQKASNKPKPNPSHKIKKRQGSNSRSTSRSQSVFIAFGSFLFIMLGSVAMLIEVEHNWIFPRTFRSSQILLIEREEIEDLLQELYEFNHTFTMQTSCKMAFAEFIKTELASIQVRLSSLKTQTLQYEQMSTRIPGGPKSFIASSVGEINSLLDNLAEIAEEGRKILREGFKFEEEHPLPFLIIPKQKEQASYETLYAFGILLSPNSLELEKEVVLLGTTVSLTEATEILKKCSALLYSMWEEFVKFEALEDEVQYKLFIKTTRFPSPLAEYIFHLGFGREKNVFQIAKVIQALLKEENEALVESSALKSKLKKVREDGRLFSEVAAQLERIKKEYAENEATFQILFPMKAFFLQRVVEEREDYVKNGKQDENLSYAYYKLMNNIYMELITLRERVVKLG